MIPCVAIWGNVNVRCLACDFSVCSLKVATIEIFSGLGAPTIRFGGRLCVKLLLLQSPFLQIKERMFCLSCTHFFYLFLTKTWALAMDFSFSNAITSSFWSKWEPITQKANLVDITAIPIIKTKYTILLYKLLVFFINLKKNNCTTTVVLWPPYISIRD